MNEEEKQVVIIGYYQRDSLLKAVFKNKNHHVKQVPIPDRLTVEKPLSGIWTNSCRGPLSAQGQTKAFRRQPPALLTPA